MANNGTLGSQQLLLATASLVKGDIIVISTYGPGGNHVISTSTGSPLTTRFIGLFTKIMGLISEVVSVHELLQKCSTQIK